MKRVNYLEGAGYLTAAQILRMVAFFVFVALVVGTALGGVIVWWLG